MPTIPAPIVPTVPEAGGGFWAGGSSSGMDETSGVSCDFSGPHTITTQTLGVQYFRNPEFQLSSLSLGLSAGLINPTYKVNATAILCRIIAAVNVSKSYDCYATSAWTQNQTFTVNAVSADTYGNVYGTAAEFSSAHVLGVAGSIETYQPYYQRRPWDATIDEESTSAITAFNFGMGYRTMNYEAPFIVTSSLIDAMTEWAEMENELYPGSYYNYAGWDGQSFLNDPHIAHSSPIYMLPGGYTYAQESMGSLKGMVDYMIGAQIQSPYTSKVWWLQDGSPFAGLPTYDWKRHDWSTIT